ncbi:IS1595 family transposase [Cohnella sp. 56]|uniref:IS1595 family transposase n=1 Tax=Cohnella sp. 56 TaxID=3113722 RepID=UPI0030E817D4
MLLIDLPAGSWESWTEAQCVEALYQARWPHGFRCPDCNYAHCSVLRTRKYPLYICSSCKRQTSITAGTVMHGTRTPLRLWFRAMLWVAEEGTSVELAEILQVTYKTAWLIGHKLRDALTQEAEGQQLTGAVAVTGGIYGFKWYSGGSLHMKPEHQPVVIGAAMDDNEELLEIKMEHMDRSVTGNSRLLGRFVYEEFAEHHAPESVKSMKMYPYYGVKSLKPLSALLRHAMNWFDHKLQGIGPKYLQAYLNHQSFVFNISRRGSNQVLGHLLHLCGTRRTVTCRQLTRRCLQLRVSKWRKFLSVC